MILRPVLALALLVVATLPALAQRLSQEDLQRTYQVAAAEILTIRERIDRAYPHGSYVGLTQAQAIRRGLISMRTTVRGNQLFSTLRAPMTVGGSRSGAGYFIQFQGIDPRLCYQLVRETLDPQPVPRSELVALVVNEEAIRAPIDLSVVDDACDKAEDADSTVMWVFR